MCIHLIINDTQSENLINRERVGGEGYNFVGQGRLYF